MPRLNPVALGVGLATMVLLAATGCAATQPLPPSAAPDAGPVQPKVSRLIVATVPPAAETNEVRNVNQRDQYQAASAYERLFANNPQTGKRENQLVSAWNLEPDGLTYRFKLRQDVRFQFDRGMLTSKDVVLSFREHMRADSLRGSSPNLRASIKAVAPVGDQEFLLQLSRPAAELLYAAGQADIISADDFAAKGAATLQSPAAGTGAYFIKERQQGSYVRFERVPYQHWRIRPDFPELEVRFIKEPSTRLAALLAGEIHTTDIPDDMHKQALVKGNFKVISSLASAQRVWVEFYGPVYKDPKNPAAGLTHTDSPMANPLIRRALSKAIDRDKLNQSFLLGKGAPMWLSHYASELPGWNADWQKRFPDEYGYDPAKAKALVTEAGYGPGNPATISMLVIDVEGLASGKDMAEAVGAYWKAIGIDMKLEDMPTQRYNDLNKAGKLDSHARIRTSGSDQYNVMSNLNDGFREGRTAGISILDGDKAFDLAKNTLDEKKQDEYLRQAGSVWYDQHHGAALFWLPQEVVANTTIIAGYPFPGNVTGSWTHLEYIKAAK